MGRSRCGEIEMWEIKVWGDRDVGRSEMWGDRDVGRSKCGR